MGKRAAQPNVDQGWAVGTGPEQDRTPPQIYLSHQQPNTTPPIHAQNLRHLHHCKRLFGLSTLVLTSPILIEDSLCGDGFTFAGRSFFQLS
jgi:hypothetical protein